MYNFLVLGVAGCRESPVPVLFRLPGVSFCVCGVALIAPAYLLFSSATETLSYGVLGWFSYSYSGGSDIAMLFTQALQSYSSSLVCQSGSPGYCSGSLPMVSVGS